MLLPDVMALLLLFLVGYSKWCLWPLKKVALSKVFEVNILFVFEIV
jgi:hypothetical protein